MPVDSKGEDMDNLVSLYTSREGRIGRKTWWLASIGLAVVVIILEFIVAAILGISLMPNMAGLADPNADAAALSAQLADNIHKSGWVSLVFFVVFFIPILSLGTKRRHDRDNNGMDLIIYLVLTIVLLLVQALGIGYNATVIGTITIPTPGPIPAGLGIIVGIYAIYMLVVMGFLKGTTGTNQYGADPLLMGSPAAA
jgi:uncharacterized membrane protein YhaH (DUF805 family)